MIFLVRPPGWINFLLKIAEPFLSKKSKVFSRLVTINKNKMDKLQEYIDASALPPQLGGTSDVYDQWTQWVDDRLHETES